jgi:hypothetical protein
MGVLAVTSKEATATAALLKGNNGLAAWVVPTFCDHRGSETVTSVNSRSSRGGRPEDFHGIVLPPWTGQGSVMILRNTNNSQFI